MSRVAARVFGGTHLGTAALVAWAVFRCLPARWLPVDTVAGIVTCSQLAAAAGLLTGSQWASAAARVTSFVALGVGLVVVSLLAAAASWLAGVYGPVGAGGGAILTLVAALTLPYLVVLPCLELVWLGRRVPTTSP